MRLCLAAVPVVGLSIAIYANDRSGLTKSAMAEIRVKLEERRGKVWADLGVVVLPEGQTFARRVGIIQNRVQLLDATLALRIEFLRESARRNYNAGFTRRGCPNPTRLGNGKTCGRHTSPNAH